MTGVTRLSTFCIDDLDEAYEKNPSPIGCGSFGEVYEATERKSGRKVAMKYMRNPVEGFDAQRSLFRELEILAKLNHPLCLSLCGFKLQEEEMSVAPAKKITVIRPVIITPLMRNGTLEDACKKRPLGWNETKMSINIFGVAAGMAYVHSKGIIHRDLKPGNIFLNDQHEPCIADFGISRADALNMTGALGTPLFMAPELFSEAGEDNGYTNKIDVYAYAVLLYRMFTQAMILDDNPRPIRSQQQLMMRVMKGARFRRDYTIPDALWNLITECWSDNAESRPSFAKIVKYFRDNVEEWAVEGTNIAELREYQERILKDIVLPDTDDEAGEEEDDFGDELLKEILNEDD